MATGTFSLAGSNRLSLTIVTGLAAEFVHAASVVRPRLPAAFGTPGTYHGKGECDGIQTAKHARFEETHHEP